jgi:uncharacterized protein with PIN domain
LDQNPRFIADAMLGSLARWLRFLGYDTLYCETEPDDEILARIDERILLTRDKELISRARKRGYPVVNPGSGSIGSMLHRLKQQLGIRFIANPAQSRCAQCNSPLLECSRDQVKGLVPNGSLRRHDRFWQCTNPRCQQVYWLGRHWIRIQKTLDKLESRDF